jgi:hypothetical protein
MPIASIPTNDRKERLIATAGQTVFAYDFPIYAATDLQVLRERAGVITTLVLGTDYTVAGANEQAGGTITLTTGALAGDIIVLLSAMPSARSTQFVNGGDLAAAALEAEFNKLRILFQQNIRDGRNALLFPPTDPAMQDLPSIALRTNRFLAFDMNGQPYAATPAAGTVLDAISRLGDNMAGRFGFVPGSATAPGLTPNNDNGSGLFSQPNLIGLSVNGQEVARFTPNRLSYPPGNATSPGMTPINDNSSGFFSSSGALGIAINGQEAARFIAGGLQVKRADFGATARTAGDKLRETISVKDFGAVGNGAVDDQPAIQAAINALQALGGGTLYFSAGTYRIDSGLVVTGSNITFRGDGYLSSVIFSNTNGFQLLRFQNASRCGIEHLGIYRNVFTTNPIDYTLWLENCVQFSARRVLMQGSYYNMVISGTASADFTFQECIWNFATGPAMVYMVRVGAGVNGAYHFYRCLLNQDYPATAPVPANYKGARANATAYAVKDVITVGGFYYQCVTAGTSAASQPAAYGTVWYLTNITDGTAVFWLMAPTTYYSARVDTGLSYVNFRECDFTSCATFGLQILNSLSGDKPISVHVEQCTYHGNITGGIHILSGQEIDLKSVEVLVPTGAGVQYGLLFDTAANNINVTSADIHAVLGDAVYIGGPGINVSQSDITGNTLGIRIAANMNRARIIGNDLGASPRWGANTNAITVTAGTSNNYVIAQNVIAGATVGITDGGTGGSKSVAGNV